MNQNVKTMHLCAATGDVKALEELHEQGAAVDALDAKGLTPLHLAVASGHRAAPDIVARLIKFGADVRIVDPKGRAAEQLARETLKQLWERVFAKHGMVLLDDYPPRSAASEAERTAWIGLKLMQRCLSKKRRLQTLMESDPTLALADPYGRTALHHAAWDNNLEVIQRWIDAGANLNIKDRDGNTALVFAASNGLAEAAGLLAQYYDSWACSLNDYEDTLVHIAARSGSVDTIRALAEAEAGIEKRLGRRDSSEVVFDGTNSVGDTPLDVALSKGNAEMAVLLVEQGAKVSGFQLQKAASKGLGELCRDWMALDSAEPDHKVLLKAIMSGSPGTVAVVLESWPWLATPPVRPSDPISVAQQMVKEAKSGTEQEDQAYAIQGLVARTLAESPAPAAPPEPDPDMSP